MNKEDLKFCDVLVKMRKEKGITQKDLADVLHVSDKAISRWETGNSLPDLEMLYHISQFYHVDFNNLLKLMLEESDTDDETIKCIIREISMINKRRARIFKISFIISLIIILFLGAAMIFTSSYNKYTVYTVFSDESENMSPIDGVYIHTRIRDTLSLSNIKLKFIDTKDIDTLSIQLFIIEKNKEKVLQDFIYRESIYMNLDQSYFEIDNLENYFDKLYIKIVITNKKGELQEYKTKLSFEKDFTNNKIYNSVKANDIVLESDIPNITDSKEITKKLLDNGFEKIGNDLIYEDDIYQIKYTENSNIIKLSYTIDNLHYNIKYNFNNYSLHVYVGYNDIANEEYNYNLNNKKLDCIKGKCDDYESVIQNLNRNVFKYLK